MVRVRYVILKKIGQRLRMAVRWEDQIDQEFTVEMRIELEHEKGLIAMLASTITGVDANIERISILERDARLQHPLCVSLPHDGNPRISTVATS